MKVVYAESARADIAGIFETIAPLNPSAALRVEVMIRSACEDLGDFPFSGVPTDEANVRRLPLVRYPYTIFYRVNAGLDRVEIARVLHGARVKHLGRMPDNG